jgi:membrane peptidoglycan carboxypeptidase
MAAAACALPSLAVLAFALHRLLAGLPDTASLQDPAWVRQRFALGQWTALQDCSPLAVRAILLSEDDTFFRNGGLRLDEVGSAAWEDLLKARYERGASSLTQQVVKNAFLGKQKTLGRKAREIVLALRADRTVGKRRLLEDYLNLAEWGPHRERGIAWAAAAYFGTSPAGLSARDGALLSWLLPDPHGRGRLLLKGELPRRARRHVHLLLERLCAEGALSAAEVEAQEQRPWPFERPGRPAGNPRAGAADNSAKDAADGDAKDAADGDGPGAGATDADDKEP